MALVFDKMLLFGDSITQMACLQDVGFAFGAAIQNLYSRKFDVILRGFGGYNSDHAALMIDKILELESAAASKIRLMVVFFGTNDSVLPSSSQNVPIKQYKENLKYIVTASERFGCKVIIVGPGPFNYHQWVKWLEKLPDDIPCDRTTLRAREYCDAAIDVSNELNVPCVPLWYLIMADLDWKEGDPIYGLAESPPSTKLEAYLSDGLHFSGKGYMVEFINIVNAIREFYPELHSDNIDEKLPPWDKLTTPEVLRGMLD
ncbi:SGNH hydrolase-type esterase domain-containing protein [Lipomyces kononenkoae]|uniref:SGNH hydrolase-type esterase domain-containing protein n=1 Tax=Lipomyces kononenkoae TaxID=34357 RepID=A0ACC3SQ08_LIPKO